MLTTPAVSLVSETRVGLEALSFRPYLHGVMQYPHTWLKDHHSLTGSTAGL